MCGKYLCMTKDSPLHPFEDSRSFWQAFVLDKYSGDIENGSKRIAENDKMVACEDSSFLRSESLLYLINMAVFFVLGHYGKHCGS